MAFLRSLWDFRYGRDLNMQSLCHRRGHLVIPRVVPTNSFVAIVRILQKQLGNLGYRDELPPASLGEKSELAALIESYRLVVHHKGVGRTVVPQRAARGFEKQEFFMPLSLMVGSDRQPSHQRRRHNWVPLQPLRQRLGQIGRRTTTPATLRPAPPAVADNCPAAVCRRRSSRHGGAIEDQRGAPARRPPLKHRSA